jgi:hypothetical protein
VSISRLLRLRGYSTDNHIGGMAGSLGLNKRFEQAVKELVGEDQYFSLRKTKGFEQAVLQFDRSIKPLSGVILTRITTSISLWLNWKMTNRID